MDLSLFLMFNSVFKGDDAFIHGFNLPEGFTIEQFSDKLFSEGLKKGERDSILSTIALIPHNREIEDVIKNYVGRGKYRVILKVPESVEGLFLGKCDRKYGDSGNQYTHNSILDLLKMPYIPPEFIVGIVYTDKHYYEEGEEISFKFIQNEGYYDNLNLGDENSKRLAAKLIGLLDDTQNNEIIKYIMTGEGKEFVDSLKEAMGGNDIGSHFRDKYGKFIEQREEYEQKLAAQKDMEPNQFAALLEEIEELPDDEMENLAEAEKDNNPANAQEQDIETNPQNQNNKDQNRNRTNDFVM